MLGGNRRWTLDASAYMDVIIVPEASCDCLTGLLHHLQEARNDWDFSAAPSVLSDCWGHLA